MPVGSAILRILATLVRIVQICCAVVICGIYIYFYITVDNEPETFIPAVIGMSAAAAVYAGFGVLLTICLAGRTIPGVLAVVLDICFIGCFAAIAYLSRQNYNYFDLNVEEPILAVAAFGIALIALFSFIFSAVLQVLMVRRHKRDKRFGPSPANNYTSGEGRRPFWKRGLGKLSSGMAAEKSSEPHPTYMHSTEAGVGADPAYGQTTGHTAYQPPPKNAATNY